MQLLQLGGQLLQLASRPAGKGPLQIRGEMLSNVLGGQGAGIARGTEENYVELAVLVSWTHDVGFV
jgi:hypothetical protein